MIEYEYQRTGQQSIQIQLKGDLDIDSTELIEDRLWEDVDGCNVVMLDFSGVMFVDSTGIGLLISLIRKLQQSDTAISIRNLQPDVREVFELLQLPAILGQEVFEESGM